MNHPQGSEINFYDDGCDAAQTPAATNDEVCIDFSWSEEDERLLAEQLYTIPRLEFSRTSNSENTDGVQKPLDEDSDIKTISAP